jgi:8-oxo-dGTP pyrophosphatase MutT (NUDIX family)
MKWEKSCGGVVFTRTGNTVRYLIIRHLGGHCGFPKGHIEPGESEQETAIREIREETGLAVSLVEGFRAADSYPFPNKSGVWKEVVYFLAGFSDQTIHTQPEEISEAYLVSYEEALRLLPFPEAKRILTEAHHFLTSK